MITLDLDEDPILWARVLGDACEAHAIMLANKTRAEMDGCQVDPTVVARRLVEVDILMRAGLAFYRQGPKPAGRGVQFGTMIANNRWAIIARDNFHRATVGYDQRYAAWQHAGCRMPANQEDQP